MRIKSLQGSGPQGEPAESLARRDPVGQSGEAGTADSAATDSLPLKVLLKSEDQVLARQQVPKENQQSPRQGEIHRSRRGRNSSSSNSSQESQGGLAGEVFTLQGSELD